MQSLAAPDFNLTGPSTMMLAASTVFNVYIHISIPITDLVFEAFAPTNYTDVVTICGMAVASVGDNFNCLAYDNIPYTLYPSASGLTNEYGRLDIGSVLNAGQCHVVSSCSSVCL